MAILNSIILGRAKGSIGNVTLSTQKGRVIAKQKATIVSNPKTDEQMLQRNGLSLAVFLWQKLNLYIKEGFTITSQYGNQYNAFVSNNINFLKNIDKDKENLTSKDVQGLAISLGKFPNPFEKIQSDSEGKGAVVINKDLLASFAKVGDKFVLIIAMDNDQEFRAITLNVSLPMLTGTNKVFPIPDLEFPNTAKLSWAAFVITDNGKTSSTSTLQSN
ncbi:DUF6266 family protein [Elizabethkingia meningoseptica]|uniref:DUF6266 family protein n=1 Tax=Elizabethkingia meningoseptica TaxID=238 RepID=UPI002DD6B4F1|nr:DUF6266 family protein [Elizabethkingia meningoseptica]MEC4711839.1 DUF6266 family protein [Elizabethkingia meningoseptica]